jgi:hypothetical protein
VVASDFSRIDGLNRRQQGLTSIPRTRFKTFRQLAQAQGAA